MKNKYLLVEDKLKELNISFSKLADYIQIPRTTLIYNLQNDKINLSYLKKIATALECSVSDLIPDEVEKVKIDGLCIYKNISYDLGDLNDFMAFIEMLVIECNIQSDIYYVPEK